MKERPPTFRVSSAATSAIYGGSQPPWVPEAKQLADACRDLASGVESLCPQSEETIAALCETEHLLTSIGNCLDHAIAKRTSAAEPASASGERELCTDLLHFAKELPAASTHLWNADAGSKTLVELEKTLPEVSVALMTLSQLVNQGLAGDGPSTTCTC